MRKQTNRYTKDDQVFVYHMLVFRSEGKSYPYIGKLFNKDHSTIIHWCKRFSVDIGTKVPTVEEFDCIMNKKAFSRTYRYAFLIDEKINPGKKNYAAYLLESKRRHPTE